MSPVLPTGAGVRLPGLRARRAQGCCRPRTRRRRRLRRRRCLRLRRCRRSGSRCWTRPGASTTVDPARGERRLPTAGCGCRGLVRSFDVTPCVYGACHEANGNSERSRRRDAGGVDAGKRPPRVPGAGAVAVCWADGTRRDRAGRDRVRTADRAGRDRAGRDRAGRGWAGFLGGVGVVGAAGGSSCCV